MTLDDVMHNWEAVLCCDPSRVRRTMSWVPSPKGALEFNIDAPTMEIQGRQIWERRFEIAEGRC